MNLENLLLLFFAGGALLGGVLMLVARHPMRVALALICSMLSLAGIYAMLGVHVIAVFQVLIYVGAVMVFMVYVIMLLDVRDPSFVRRYGHALVPGVVTGVLLAAVLGYAVLQTGVPDPAVLGRIPAGLLAALRTDVGAAGGRGRGGHRRDQGRAEERWIEPNSCSASASRCSHSGSSA
jgi:NADH-quinone oxidoreductase subunit J